jgi:CHASE2 domain-containing sensor protein/signal transduction histidine kinase
LRFYKSPKYQALISRQGLLLILLALLISLFSAYLAYAGQTQSLDWLYYDNTQKYSHLPPPDDVVMIDIDDKSINKIGRWPWPRKEHARLLDILSTTNTKAVIIDVLFPDIDTRESQSDLRFAQAIKRHGKVILPIHFEMLGQQGLVVESPPHTLFYSKALALGHVHLETETDGIVRSVFLKEGVGTAFWPHLALALLEKLNTHPSDQPLIPGNRVQDRPKASLSVNIERDYHNLIPMPAAEQGLRHYSYSDILEGVIDPAAFNNKLVYIGATAAGLGDVIATPIGNMFGVELNAWIFQALRHNQMIQNYAKGTVALVTFITVLLFVLVMGQLSPRFFLIFSILGIASVLALSAALLLFEHRWFPPTSMVIGLVLFFPLWSWLRAEYVLRFLRDEIELLSEGIQSPHSLANSKQSAQRFLEQTGMLNISTNQQTPMGQQAIKALYSGRESKHDTEHFWQQQIAKYDANIGPQAKKNEGVELIARTISQLSTIKQNDQKNRQLIEKSLSRLQDAVCITDLCGKITFTNKHFKKWFHHDIVPKEASASSDSAEYLLSILNNIELKSELSWSQVLSSLYQTGQRFTGEATLSSKTNALKNNADKKHSSNSDRQLLCQASLVSINETHHDTLILSFTDITQLKEAENARAEALSFLSHDLRSPMVSVLAILENYHSEPSSSDRRLSDTAIQSIKTLVTKNLDYAESFLQLSKADALLETSMNPCDLHAVLDGAQVYAHALAAPKSISVVTERSDDDAWVLGDLALLERALNNLISNAIKFSPAGSCLTLALEKYPTALQLSVVDQGHGIAKKDQAGLFERFTRLKRSESTEGAGLGLNFVATVVKKHQGKITLDSELNIGTTFIIHLPFLNEQDLFNH